MDSFTTKVCCVFPLESPHRGDSNVYIQINHFQYKRKAPQIIPNLQLSDFSLGTQKTSKKITW